MSSQQRPVIVVEDDPFPRLLQVVLDPDTDPERCAAFARLLQSDGLGFAEWCAHVRRLARGLYPAHVAMVASQDELRAMLGKAHVAIVEELGIAADDLDLAPNLKLVQKYGTVTRNIDAAACKARGVGLLTLERRVNVSCAEHALALMFALARKLTRVSGLISARRLAAAGYRPATSDPAHTPTSAWSGVAGLGLLDGGTLGILGLGEIGRVLAPRAAGLGMDVVYFQRTRLGPEEERRYHARYLPLDELLAASDWLSIHLPETPETRDFLGAPELARLKPGARLINVSRARLVNREALIAALRSGHLGGVAMDALYDEPGRDDDELLGFDNVILTPHIAGQFRANGLVDFETMVAGLARAFEKTRR